MNKMTTSSATFGPDGETLDAVQRAIELCRKSLHEAVERQDYRQVKGLTNCLMALDRAIWNIKPDRY